VSYIFSLLYFIYGSRKKSIAQNIFVYVPQKKESYRFGKMHTMTDFYFWVNCPFKWQVRYFTLAALFQYCF